MDRGASRSITLASGEDSIEPRDIVGRVGGSLWGFPCSSVSKESACSAGDRGSIPGSGRSPGEGNGNALQYSCLENPMNRRAWQATVHGVTKGQT